MKRDFLSTVLVTCLVMSTAATAVLCYQYLSSTSVLRFMQERANLAGQRRAAIQALTIELNEHARRDASLEQLLEKLNIRMRANTNLPPAKP